MLQEFERDKGGDWRSSTFQDETLKSQYRDVLDTYEIPSTTAHRWQNPTESDISTF